MLPVFLLMGLFSAPLELTKSNKFTIEFATSSEVEK